MIKLSFIFYRLCRFDLNDIEFYFIERWMIDKEEKDYRIENRGMTASNRNYQAYISPSMCFRSLPRLFWVSFFLPKTI